MHRVLNYGSALQAYALQNVLEGLGHDVEIIDYVYPNDYHKSCHSKPNFFKALIRSILEVLRGYPRKRNEYLFNNFYMERLNLTETYNSPEELYKNPPKYDIYMTGSDQVWNPKSIHEDTSFMLSFTDSPNKVAYSASFATSIIPEEYKQRYSLEINKYKHILMRELSGCKLVAELTGETPEIVCDPTLLLKKEQWLNLANHSNIDINGNYILVYVLGYSFNVYPYIYELIEYVQEKAQMQLVVLSFSNKYVGRLKNKKIVRSASVYDFLKLFANASMVITDSFHGTAFSLNLNIPFYSVVNDQDNLDSRVVDLLKLTGEETRIIRKNSDFRIRKFNLTSPHSDKLNHLRETSIEKLKSIIS